MMNPPPPPTVLLEEDTSHHYHHQQFSMQKCIHQSTVCCSLRESKGERRGSIHNYNCNAYLPTFFLPFQICSTSGTTRECCGWRHLLHLQQIGCYFQLLLISPIIPTCLVCAEITRRWNWTTRAAIRSVIHHTGARKKEKHKNCSIITIKIMEKG